MTLRGECPACRAARAGSPRARPTCRARARRRPPRARPGTWRPRSPSARASPRTACRRSLAPASRAIARSMSGLTELSGKTASHVLAADLVDELLNVAGRRLRLGRQRRDHGAHDPRRRTGARSSRARRASSRSCAGPAGRAPRTRRSRVERAQPALQPRRVPPVGAARPPGRARSDARGWSRRRARRCAGPATSAGRRRSRSTESISETTFAFPPALVDHVAEPVVHLAARPEDEIGLRHGGHVARPRLVVVRVAARPEHPVDRDPVAAHLAHEVGHLSGGGDDRASARRSSEPFPHAAATSVTSRRVPSTALRTRPSY